MQSKNAVLFAVGLLSVGFWPHDGARCQTSLAPPPATTAKRSAPPDTGWKVLSPKPGTDYDGRITGVEADRVPKLRVRPRAANQPKQEQEPDNMAARRSDDPWQIDEQIKRKITICRGCQ